MPGMIIMHASHACFLCAGSTSSSTSGSTCTALMGPSGSGKTTLLDILAGRRCGWGVSGDVRMNGRLTSPDMRMKMSGYVLQVISLLPY